MLRSIRYLEVFMRTLIVILPWRIKRFFLQRFFGYDLDVSSFIGLSWIYPKILVMKAGSSIDSLCVAVNLDKIVIETNSRIGRNNWITGFPSATNSRHFSHQPERKAELIIGKHSAISKNHHIDCTNSIHIGSFTTIAGYSSQFLTHSIDLDLNIQNSLPISIGSYCFIGTNCIVLGGSILPDYSILGAHSLLNKPHSAPWALYAGSPAIMRKNIDRTALYFSRAVGFVI